jgi:DUF3047 family protein
MDAAMTTRRAFVGGALATALLAARHGAAQDARVVEDWTTQAPGASGVPAGWRPYETPFGRPAYAFSIVENDGRRGLCMKSTDEHSTIAKDPGVRLASTPVLRWDWKVLSFPSGADLREWSRSDATGHLFVVWPRFPTLVRSRLIGYVWDPTLPAGTVMKSRKTGTVTFIVTRSGSERRGQWVTDERNVVEDYRRAFGEGPEDPKAIALSIDTNDTHSSAEAVFGRIAFSGR